VLAFSYAIVAIAITLLTLDLEVRPGLPGDDLARALHQVLPAQLGQKRLFGLLPRRGA